MSQVVGQLIKRQLECDTLVCCGLDPDITKLPPEIKRERGSDEDKILRFLQGVVEATALHVCAYKPQKAFFDILPNGHDILRKVIAFIHTQNPGIPVLLDCKVGDIDNTMSVYMRNILDVLGADGMLVNPYMGDDVLAPFSKRPDKAAVVLVRTSNSGSSITQDIVLANGSPYWSHMLDLVVNRWNEARNLIPVVSSTATMDMGYVRTIVPDDMPILLAGMGAQGGQLTALTPLLNKQRVGVYVNSSRGILYVQNQPGQTWQQTVEAAAIKLKQQLNLQRI